MRWQIVGYASACCVINLTNPGVVDKYRKLVDNRPQKMRADAHPVKWTRRYLFLFITGGYKFICIE